MEEHTWRSTHGAAVVEEESWRGNHGGAAMEEQSWSSSHEGAIVKEQACRRQHRGALIQKGTMEATFSTHSAHRDTPKAAREPEQYLMPNVLLFCQALIIKNN